MALFLPAILLLPLVSCCFTAESGFFTFISMFNEFSLDHIFLSFVGLLIMLYVLIKMQVTIIYARLV